MNKPNLLLIFTDQQRWDTMAAYGNKVIKTPNMDRLAGQGAVFENGITPCPICVAARASTMTGYSAGKNGILNNKGEVSDPRDALPAYLSNIGYCTQAIGKMHFSPRGETYGMQGMILSEEMRSTRFAKDLESQWFDDYDRFLIKNKMWGWEKPPEIGYNEIKPLINEIPKEFHVTQWCGNQTIEWLQNGRDKDKPFFLFSSFVKPHVPYDCPAHLVDLYHPDDMPLPWTVPGEVETEYPGFAHLRINHEWDLYSEDAARRAKAFYYANISFIDEQIGRILDELDQQGLTENTLVIFTADHGDMMGDHGLWYKAYGYEGSLHIPFLFRWPERIQAGTRRDDIVSLTDIFPTFMEAAGLIVGEKRPGKNLLEFIENRAVRDVYFSEFGIPGNLLLHVRHKKWKYLYFQKGGWEELYDLEKDPQELYNLAGKSESDQIRGNLKKEAESWIQEYSNPRIFLDAEGSLKSFPMDETDSGKMKYNRNPTLFSRMPWESRFPPASLQENKIPWWWKETGGDWSRMIEFLKREKG